MEILYFTPVCQKSWWYDLPFLRYREWQTEIGNYWSFFALLPCTPPHPHPLPKNLKSQNFEKFFFADITILCKCTKTTKTTIIRGTVPETQSETDRTFYHFRAFFTLFLPKQPRKLKSWKNERSISRCHHFTHVYQKSQSYNKYFPKHGVWHTQSSVILGHFCPLTPLLTPKIKI